MVFQGHSEITKIKQRDLRDLVSMRIHMLLSHFRDGGKLLIRDALCGDGENTIEGTTIDGSSLSAMMGIQDAFAAPNMRGLSHLIRGKFSDIRSKATQHLEALIEQQFNFSPDLFAENSYAGLIEVETQAAANAIAQDRLWLEGNLKRYMVFIDPNGPKDLPYLEVAALLNSKAGRERADVILNISATAIKRILGWEAAQKNIAEWIGNFDATFIKALGAKNEAWIRCPLEGDQWQWTMLVLWSHPVPKNDWRKRGYVKLDSAEGRNAIDVYTLTREKTKQRRLRVVEGGKS